MAEPAEDFLDPFADGYDAFLSGQQLRNNPWLFGGFDGSRHRKITGRSQRSQETSAETSNNARMLWIDGYLTGYEDRYSQPLKIVKAHRGD